MEIEVKLFSMLCQYKPDGIPGAPHHPFTMTIPEETTIAMLAAELGIPDGFVNAAAVNGEVVDVDTRLRARDKVSLFPPAAGGSHSRTYRG